MRPKNLLAVALAAGLPFLGCDSGTSPVAPEGTLMSITANPMSISLSGVAAVQVIALHPTGVPARSGTEIRFSTTLGQIEELARTDANGVARATLQADGRAGSATVTASSGVKDGGSTMNSVEVTVTISASELQASFGYGEQGSRQKPGHACAATDISIVSPTVRTAAAENSTSQFVTVSAS